MRKKILGFLILCFLMTGCGEKKQETPPSHPNTNEEYSNQNFTEEELQKVTTVLTSEQTEKGKFKAKLTFKNNASKEFYIPSIELTVKDKSGKILQIVTQKFNIKVLAGTEKQLIIETNTNYQDVVDTDQKIMNVSWATVENEAK